MSVQKIAVIVKRKEQFCVRSHSKGKGGEHKVFGCYETKGEAKSRLKQIKMFSKKKASLLGTMLKVSDELDEQGKIHIADALTGCIQTLSDEDVEGNSSLRLGKIVCLLESKGEHNLAERIDAMLPEIVKFECVDCDIDVPQPRKRINAQRAYNICKILEKKYLEGEVDADGFEHCKMKELKAMLKQGFSFPLPTTYDEYPEDHDNWWNHFETMRGKK